MEQVADWERVHRAPRDLQSGLAARDRGLECAGEHPRGNSGDEHAGLHLGACLLVVEDELREPGDLVEGTFLHRRLHLGRRQLAASVGSDRRATASSITRPSVGGAGEEPQQRRGAQRRDADARVVVEVGVGDRLDDGVGLFEPPSVREQVGEAQARGDTAARLDGRSREPGREREVVQLREPARLQQQMGIGRDASVELPHDALELGGGIGQRLGVRERELATQARACRRGRYARARSPRTVGARPARSADRPPS